MIYTDASTMILTRNCLALSTTDAVQAVALLQSKVTFVNGCYSNVNLLTGAVTYHSIYRKKNKHNKVNADPKAYEITPVYFANPDDTDRESLYRHGKVHILNVSLSAYHRELFELALQRASEQDECDLADTKVHIHHINGDKRDNSVHNLLPVTDSEHYRIHNALRRGASTYDALVAGLGVNLVNIIFGEAYFNYGDCSVFTAKLHGESYIKRMLTQLSGANLPAGCTSLRVKCLNEKYACVDIQDMNVYELLSELYTVRAVDIVSQYNVQAI